ncbi:MFS general substrate transporter [Ceraceosorus guamensis]|uniref:MFS general substrate transporter n=1 Tax=Ceraceosorus guamensis TaxID=1522189 RepID=A0A316VSZ5_9BASI|nr:MFS general substrate transporter [Ceraceosorus guamensis]PWN40612.1 MFS general substrate transporter [Ceraceosorus guamensis]
MSTPAHPDDAPSGSSSSRSPTQREQDLGVSAAAAATTVSSTPPSNPFPSRSHSKTSMRSHSATVAPPSLDKRERMLALDSGLDDVIQRKMLLVNRNITQMGFGRFQMWMVLLSGCGWAVDNIIFQSLSMSLPQVKLEFQPGHVQFLTLALYVGLLFGAFFWGFGSDVVGRKLAWQTTLFLGSVFMLVVGFAPSFAVLAVLLALAGFGIGGNLPVDGAMLIEFLPGDKQYILTALSAFWCAGQLFAALIGWAFITNFRCSELPCPRSENMGWRYSWFTVGGVTLLLWVVRFFIYPIPESPKFLIVKGRDAEAIRVLDFIAHANGRPHSLTLDSLARCEEQDLNSAGTGTEMDAEKHATASSADRVDASPPDEKDPIGVETRSDAGTDAPAHRTTAAAFPNSTDQAALRQASTRDKEMRVRHRTTSFALRLQRWKAEVKRELKRSASQYDAASFKSLFHSPRMTLNTTLICASWGLIGCAYPLYNAFIALYISSVGGSASSPVQSQAEQYRDLVIIAAMGIPGSIIATGAVELPYLGRRFAMAFFTLLTGACLFGFTSARTPSAVLGWNCGASLSQNAMYGILYAITYEVFPTHSRGTGDGLAMGVQRIFGITGPLIAAYGSDASPTTPVFVSASLFVGASVLMLGLPYEPRGVESL